MWPHLYTTRQRRRRTDRRQRSQPSCKQTRTQPCVVPSNTIAGSPTMNGASGSSCHRLRRRATATTTTTIRAITRVVKQPQVSRVRMEVERGPRPTDRRREKSFASAARTPPLTSKQADDRITLSTVFLDRSLKRSRIDSMRSKSGRQRQRSYRRYSIELISRTTGSCPSTRRADRRFRNVGLPDDFDGVPANLVGTHRAATHVSISNEG